MSVCCGKPQLPCVLSTIFEFPVVPLVKTIVIGVELNDLTD